MLQTDKLTKVNSRMAMAKQSHKLTDTDVRQIYRHARDGCLHVDIAKWFGISTRTVRRIMNKETHSHITGEMDAEFGDSAVV